MGNNVKSMNDKPIHNVNTGKTFSKIQDAIDDVETIEGHIILVDPGTYEENVKVNKELTIASASGPEDTTVKAKDPKDHVFEVTANGVTIKGFTVYGARESAPSPSDFRSFRSGIYLNRASHCIISSNYCGYIGNYDRSNHKYYRAVGYDKSNMCDIFLTDKSTNNTIIDNLCIRNKNTGISVEGSKNVIIGNICNRSGHTGISVGGSDNSVTGNTCNTSIYYGILVDGLNNIVVGNTCNENRNNIVLGRGGKNNIVAGNIIDENASSCSIKRASRH